MVLVVVVVSKEQLCMGRRVQRALLTLAVCFLLGREWCLGNAGLA